MTEDPKMFVVCPETAHPAGRDERVTRELVSGWARFTRTVTARQRKRCLRGPVRPRARGARRFSVAQPAHKTAWLRAVATRLETVPRNAQRRVRRGNKASATVICALSRLQKRSQQSSFFVNVNSIPCAVSAPGTARARRAPSRTRPGSRTRRPQRPRRPQVCRFPRFPFPK